MRRSVKGILVASAALPVLVYIVSMGILSSLKSNNLPCPALAITITDYHARQYVTVEELENLLRAKGVYPVGRMTGSISTQAIEDVVSTHPMVRLAECHMTQAGTVCVRLSQRIPILRVVTASESYFVDTDCKRMQVRESVDSSVLLATGNVGERMAENELAELALWIMNSRYWSEKIRKIHVVNPRMVQLVQNPDGTLILLGEIDDYKRKLGKLRILYDKGFDQIGWQTYREIDLRFNGQVIGRK